MQTFALSWVAFMLSSVGKEVADHVARMCPVDLRHLIHRRCVPRRMGGRKLPYFPVTPDAAPQILNQLRAAVRQAR